MCSGTSGTTSHATQKDGVNTSRWYVLRSSYSVSDLGFSFVFDERLRVYIFWFVLVDFVFVSLLVLRGFCNLRFIPVEL